MNGLIHIALATFNGERHLLALLESIRAQTWPHWQIVARDDGSIDQTVKILRQFQTEQPCRLRLLEDADGTLGPSANFSRLLENCQADYIMLADQDDIWLPEKIEKTLQTMQGLDDEAGGKAPLLVHTDLRVVGTARADSFWKYQNLNPAYGLKFKNLLTQNVVTGCTVMVNRSLLDLALPVPPQAIMHDWWLALIAAAFGRIGFINSQTIQYRQHGENCLGAKSWSVQEIMNTIWSERILLHEKIRKTWEQAEALRNRHTKSLPKKEKNILDAYIRLNSVGPCRRRILAILHGFFKDGLLRSLGFYWAL